MKTSEPTPLDNALAKLKEAISALPVKQQTIITKWLFQWCNFLSNEKTFKQELLPSYKRGDIVYVEFGWNVGSEDGGVHYAVVIENNNPKRSGTVLVVPFTSLGAGKKPADVARHDVYLGKGVIPWTSHETVAKLLQMRAISKMRILKPVNISIGANSRITAASSADRLINSVGSYLGMIMEQRYHFVKPNCSFILDCKRWEKLIPFSSASSFNHAGNVVFVFTALLSIRSFTKSGYTVTDDMT